jgi:hypothetical protein
MHLLVFHAYINKCTVQEAKSPVKISHQAALRRRIYFQHLRVKSVAQDEDYDVLQVSFLSSRSSSNYK